MLATWLSDLRTRSLLVGTEERQKDVARRYDITFLSPSTLSSSIASLLVLKGQWRGRIKKASLAMRIRRAIVRLLFFCLDLRRQVAVPWSSACLALGLQLASCRYPVPSPPQVLPTQPASSSYPPGNCKDNYIMERSGLDAARLNWCTVGGWCVVVAGACWEACGEWFQGCPRIR